MRTRVAGTVQTQQQPQDFDAQRPHDRTALRTSKFGIGAVDADRDAAIALKFFNRFVRQDRRRASEYFQIGHGSRIAS
jgi:hypothetical protein